MIPKILKEHKMDEVQITFNKNAIHDISMFLYFLQYIVLFSNDLFCIQSVQKYTLEAGVRDLQRKLEAICHFIAVEIVENADKEVKNYVITPKSLLNILGVNTSYSLKLFYIFSTHFYSFLA